MQKEVEIIPATIYTKSIKPIDFCGETLLWELEIDSMFEVPRDIKAIKGEHDYNDCDICQNALKDLTKILKDKFEGKSNTEPFPYCCRFHSNLVNDRDFDKGYFIRVPEMVARKIIYTNQQIVNKIDSENWYKEITDYIEYAILSFGRMPKNCGGPLYLGEYFSYIINWAIKGNNEISKKKKAKLLKYIDDYRDAKKTKQSIIDLEGLMSTYEKWISIFPFELSYFSHLKQKYLNELPFLKGDFVTNIYTGITKSTLHTKKSLFESLLSLTRNLITTINGLQLYKNDLLNNAEKIKLELIVNGRQLKINQGYGLSNNIEEKEYSKILYEWFEDEKKFIEEIKPYLKDSTVSETPQNDFIVDQILRLGLEMEKFPESYFKNGENDFRNNFIIHLNAFNKNFVSGETFNKYGKTDVLITNNNKEIEFIAECKLWTGKGQIIPTIEQLFNRYVGWRNNQVAIIIFNNSVGSFSEILEKARNELKNHPLFLEFVGVRKENCSYSYIFKHPDDDRRKINTELMLFNFYSSKK